MLNLKELLFPRRCPVCDKPVKPCGAYICTECIKKLKYVKEPVCMKCGRGLKDGQQEYCYDCAHKKHEYVKGVSLYEYGSIRNTIYRFKYGGRQEYAAFLGEEMARRLGKRISAWRPDALVPVPLHPARMRKRGYNQAQLLAEEAGRHMGIPVKSDWIIREKNTEPLKLLDGRARQNNLKKAFKIKQNDVKLNTIVIIDDIYTTGSTMDEIAGECKRCGVRNVYFAALSIGSGIS